MDDREVIDWRLLKKCIQGVEKPKRGKMKTDALSSWFVFLTIGLGCGLIGWGLGGNWKVGLGVLMVVFGICYVMSDIQKKLIAKIDNNTELMSEKIKDESQYTRDIIKAIEREKNKTVEELYWEEERLKKDSNGDS